MPQVDAEWERSADIEAENTKMDPNDLDGEPAGTGEGLYKFTVLLIIDEGMRDNEEDDPRDWIHQMHVTSEQNSVPHAIRLAQHGMVQEMGWLNDYTPTELEVLQQAQLPIAVFSGHLSDHMEDGV